MQLDLNGIALFSETLSILGLGMLGIFVVTFAIILVIALLNRAANAKKRPEV